MSPSPASLPLWTPVNQELPYEGVQINIFHACRFHPKHHQRQLWRPRCIALACNLIYAIHPLVPTQTDFFSKLLRFVGELVIFKCIDSMYLLDVPIPINMYHIFYNIISFSAKQQKHIQFFHPLGKCLLRFGWCSDANSLIEKSSTWQLCSRPFILACRSDKHTVSNGVLKSMAR